MAFTLDSVVPWGRNFQEYQEMFQLTKDDLGKRIAGFGDGPASFNCEAARKGCVVTSFDPVYRFSKGQLQARIEEVRPVVLQQTRENRDKYRWDRIKSVEELDAVRMSAMELFLADYEQGRAEGRYVAHALPERLPCEHLRFELGLSSHFLLLYPALGYEFHIRAITEMLRVCQEVRIFPIVDLDANQTELAASVMEHFRHTCTVQLHTTTYEFQKGGNRLLSIRHP